MKVRHWFKLHFKNSVRINRTLFLFRFADFIRGMLKLILLLLFSGATLSSTWFTLTCLNSITHLPLTTGEHRLFNFEKIFSVHRSMCTVTVGLFLPFYKQLLNILTSLPCSAIKLSFHLKRAQEITKNIFIGILHMKRSIIFNLSLYSMKKLTFF